MNAAGSISETPSPESRYSFGPDSAIWQINRELVTLLGGPCAAILQVAHPQVALGVAHHSHFRKDAFGRLHRTLEAVYTFAFGTREESARLKKHIETLHRKVQGSHPETYSAFSPDAQFWVLATLIETALEIHERFFKPIDDAQKAAFYSDMKEFGEFFGLDRKFGPATYPEFQVYYRHMLDGPLLVSRTECIEVAQAVAIPKANLFETVSALPIQFLVTEVLPSPVREKLGFRSNPVNRTLAGTAQILLPHLIPHLPHALRFPRQYRSAIRDFPTVG